MSITNDVFTNRFTFAEQPRYTTSDVRNFTMQDGYEDDWNGALILAAAGMPIKDGTYAVTKRWYTKDTLIHRWWEGKEPVYFTLANGRVVDTTLKHHAWSWNKTKALDEGIGALFHIVWLVMDDKVTIEKVQILPKQRIPVASVSHCNFVR